MIVPLPMMTLVGDISPRQQVRALCRGCKHIRWAFSVFDPEEEALLPYCYGCAKTRLNGPIAERKALVLLWWRNLSTKKRTDILNSKWSEAA